MRELREETFSGNKDEDTHDHIDRFLSIVGLFNIPRVLKDAVMLQVFPFTLIGETQQNVGGQLTPGTNLFLRSLNKAFYLKVLTHLPLNAKKALKILHKLQASRDESLYQAWSGIMGLPIHVAPTHGTSIVIKKGCAFWIVLNEDILMSNVLKTNTARYIKEDTSYSLPSLHQRPQKEMKISINPGDLDNSTNNVLIPLDSWTSGLLVYRLPLNGWTIQTLLWKTAIRNKINWQTATHGKIRVDDDLHDLGSVETEFPAIVFNDTLTSKATLSCEPTVSSLNNYDIDFRISFDEIDDEDYTILFDKNLFSYKMISVNDLKKDSENDYDKVNMPLLPSPKPMVSYFDDLDYFNDFEKEFPATVYNDAQMSKSDLLTEPILNHQHIDGFNLKDETSLSECDEKEQNVLHFNDLFPFNIIYPDDSKLDKDNGNDKIDIKHS
ncbi:hypothetical protein Tco_0480300 [Tanacetum coccineum]